MSVTTVSKTWAEWRLYGPGYGWSTRYTASATITVTRNTGSDTATVQISATMTTPSGDNSLGPWQCITTINGANSGGGEKTFDLNTAGYHAANSSYTASQTYTVGVGVSAGTLSGTIKMRIGGYPDYQGEYSEAQSWSLTYDTKGTPSQATWSNYYFGNASTVTIQRAVPDFRESVYLVWSDNTTVTLRTYSQSSATTITYTIPYNTCPTNAQSRNAKIRVVTYNGSTQIGTWESGTYSVTIKSGDNTYKPTLSANPTCQAYNDVVVALGTDTAVAQYSKLNVKAKKADVSLKYSATIVSRVVTFSNGSSASADQEDHISSLLTSAGTITWTYKVTDSRGLTVEKSDAFVVINSSAPSITNVTIFRGDSGGTEQEGGAYLYATATANCESLNGHNSVTLKGKVDSGAYQDMTNGVRKTLKSDADANTQYVITLTATDLLRPTSIQILIPAAIIPFHVTSDKDGAGIGIKGTSGYLNVGFDGRFYKELVQHDNGRNIDVDVRRGLFLGATGAYITNNSNLNSRVYCSAGNYYCSTNAGAASLSGCPTTVAFQMWVYNLIGNQIPASESSYLYYRREILDISGNRYVQNVSGGATLTFGSWYKVCTTQVTKTNITPSVGSNYSGMGNSYYEVSNNLVHIHLGLQGLTANSVQQVFQMPSGYRPTSVVYVLGQGGSSYTSVVYAKIEADGKISVRPYDQYANADFWYFI